MDNANLDPYIDLIKSFLNDKIKAPDFKRRYLDLFKQDSTPWEGEEYEVLNGLFGDLDMFYPDPKLRDPGDMDEPQLRERAEAAVNRLLTLSDRR